MEFKSYEVRPCIEQDENVVSFVDKAEWEAETARLDNAGIAHKSYWTLYGRHANGLASAIADFASGGDASDVLELLKAPEKFNRNESLAGLCVWEAFLEAKDDSALARHKARHGTCESREYALNLGRYCEAVYASKDALAWDEWPFDWEVIPEILDYLESEIDNDSTDFRDPESVANVVIARLSSRS